MEHNDIPSIDVLVVTYNNESTLSPLIESLYAQEKVRITIYCVDNSPNNKTFSLIQKLLPQGWYYHDRSNPGLGASINRAARIGCGDWVLIINPDAYFVHSYDLYHLWQAALALRQVADSDQIILGPRIGHPDGTSYPTGRAFPSIVTGSIHALRTLFTSQGAKKYLHPPGIPLTENISAVDWISGAAMFLPRKTFEALAGFNPRYYMYAEDIDLCWRLRQKGGIVGRLESLQLVHLGAVSSGGGNHKTIRWHHISMIKFLLATTHGLQRFALLFVIPGLILRYALALLKLGIKRIYGP